MSAIVLGGIQSRRTSKRIRPRPIAQKVFVAPPESRAVRYRRVARKAFFWSSILAVIVFVIGAVASVLFYNHYASIVEKRVNAGFWQTRAGMYAAPYQIRKDQQASPDTIVELLRRAGYIEGNPQGNTWSGSFERTGNNLEITTSDAYNLDLETTTIKFTGNKIYEIRQNGVLADNYQIEPEMLSGRSETKRAKNHVLKFEEIPEHLRNAMIAAEDQRFFEHHGLDPRGIGRAVVANLSGREIKQGGSTITQQLVKNTFLTPERSFTRKFAEAFLSVALENKMSKQDIFAVYCNEIYLGQYGASGVHGVEQAARAYFGKELKDVNLAEAATIAALIKNPRAFSPLKNPENSKMRRNWILGRMHDLDLANDGDIELAKTGEVKLSPPKTSDRSIAPYFVDAAMREITEKFEGDYLNSNFNTRVYTTIDTQMQTIAEKSVAKHLDGLDKYFAKKGKRLQASIVALDPRTGHVLAMVGGRDYRESQFNRATDALRSPGSTFKPIVYATAFERGMTPISVAADRPTEFFMSGGKTYEPANYHDSYSMHNITLKSALVKSSNVIAVKTAMDVGLASVAKKARDFGFQNVEAWPSMALGTSEVTPLQLAAAYAVFANGGSSVQPTFIDKVVSGSDETLHLSNPNSRPIIKEQTAYMVTDALMDVVRRGTAAKANGALGKSVVFAGKTGTTKDGWFVGYTPNLVTVAWVGFDDNEDLHATGGDIALPLWVDFMRDVTQLRPEYGGSSFAMPKGLTQVVIDPETGMAAGDFCPQRETAVVPTSAATFVKCFKHEPMQNMYAMNEVNETVPYETTIAAVNVEPQIQTDTRHIVTYEDYSQGDDKLNIRRPTSASEQPPPPPVTRRSTVDESDLDAYERNLEKLKKRE
ncbi:MAG: PBP1A family penicillin-binding protein [Pyrinomonadaceae bacterium]